MVAGNLVKQTDPAKLVELIFDEQSVSWDLAINILIYVPAVLVVKIQHVQVSVCSCSC